MTDFSARDLARDLLAAGIRPGGGSAMDAFADPSPQAVEARMAAAVIRAAERELGVIIPSADTRSIDYRMAGHIAAAVSRRF